MYLSKNEYDELGKFDLIYFTGVLYHNPEQLRFIKKLYEKLNINGVLVLESATIRNQILRKSNVVQVWYPETYRDTTTITHMPSKNAIKSWLRMAGFSKILDSNCYVHENYDVKNTRYACFAQRQEEIKRLFTTISKLKIQPMLLEALLSISFYINLSTYKGFYKMFFLNY